jgi:serine/threonine protein kinase
MAKILDNLGGEPVNEGEAVAVYDLKKMLPENYLLYPNLEIPVHNQKTLELDLVIIAPHAVYAVEIKDWHGKISGDDNRDWAVGAASRANPYRSINYKAKVLKGRLETYGPALKDVWVEPVILIIDPYVTLNLHDVCLRKTHLLHKFPAFAQSPARLAPHVAANPNLITGGLLEIVRRAVGSDGVKGRSKQPYTFQHYEVVDELREEDGLREFIARNTLLPGTPPVRLRVFEFSPYMPKTELEHRRRKITNEANLVRKIGVHPNLLPVMEIFPVDGNKLVEVTDWSKEGTLAALLTAKTAVPLKRKLDIIRALLFGLEAVHKNGIMHRAITPANILLDESLVPRLMNFDRARLDAAPPPAPGANVPTTWQPLKDPNEQPYLPPELDRTDYKAYYSSDIYSLGVIFYELLTGVTPYLNAQDALARAGAVPKVSELVQGLPFGLDDFIHRMFSVNHAIRYQDATQALSELDNILNPQPENAVITPPSGVAPDKRVTPIKTEYVPNDFIDVNYLVVDKLGEGGSSRVYKVYNHLHDKMYALKVINAGVELGRLQKEFQLLKALDHPSIARAEWAGQTDTQHYYLVSELVSGETLSEYVNGDLKMNVGEALAIMKDVLDALEYLHTPQPNRSQPILHRDIKPSNIIRTKGGVKLIDFNIATLATEARYTLVGTQGYVAPDFILQGWDATCDLYSAGVVLYQLVTGQHPYGNELPSLESRPWPPREIMPELTPAFADFLVKACLPKRTDRFASAPTMRDELLGIKTYTQEWLPPVENDSESPAALVELETAELSRPDYNPYVTRFLTLYSQASRTNRGTRGLSDIARATYVSTMLDEKLLPAILDGKYRLVIITGNAGDGKTAFIQNLEEKVRSAGGAVERLAHGNGSRFRHNGLDFVTNYDGSQDEGENVNDNVLHDFFKAFAGDNAPGSETGAHLIAINEGRLRDFLDEDASYKTFKWLRQHVLNFFDNPSGRELPDNLLIVNLNWRSVVAGGADSIFTRQLKVFAHDSFWQPCQSCSIKDECFIKFNADTFRDRVNGSEITERLRTVFETVHLRRRLHITMRDMRSALSYLIFRDHTCEDVKRELAQTLERPEAYLANFYYNVLAGSDATEVEQTAPDTRDADNFEARGDRLIRLLTQIDVALVSNPQIDREMHFDGRTGGPPLFDLTFRSKVDESWLEKLQERLVFGYEVAHDPELIRQHRIFHHMERRKAFFERRENGWLTMLPYDQLTIFRKLTRQPENDPAATVGRKKELEEYKNLLVFGISASEGLRVRRSHRNKEHIWLRASQTDKPSVKSYRLFPTSDFQLLAPTIGSLGEYLEYTADHLILRHNERAAEAELIVGLDLFELLHNVAGGFRPSLNDLHGAFINLTIFRNSLSHLSFRELLLTENDRDFYRLRADDTNRIVLTKEEAL